ncbi:MAG: DUF2934 domain-containing protein [Gammaproteobacteria bacterium]
MTKVVSRSGRNTKAAGGEAERRCHMIAEAAYFRALERQFAPGQDIDDWLQAEKDVDATLLQSSGR